MNHHKVLLIDDDPDHLMICSIILRNNGFKVSTLKGCEEISALFDTLIKFGPDLIFMDHDMKGLCGADLTRALKQEARFSQIPVIYFTGRDDIINLARDAGADGYFSKPFKGRELVTTALHHLQNAKGNQTGLGSSQCA